MAATGLLLGRACFWGGWLRGLLGLRPTAGANLLVSGAVSPHGWLLDLGILETGAHQLVCM